MKHFRGRCKRAVAGLLSAAMLSTFSVETFAMGESIDEAEENALEQELYVSDEYAKEHPNGVFTFKDLKIQANEDDGTTEITVVRKGGTEGKASVKFKAVDITTLYGIDYDIEVKEGLFKDKLEPNPEMEPLINQYIDEDNYAAKPEDEILSDAAAYMELANDAEDQKKNTEENSVEETENISTEETTETENEEAVQTVEGKVNSSGLRSAYAIYTGSNPKKNDWRNATAEKMDEESMALLPENMAETMKSFQSAIPGVEYTLDFDEGEYAKKLIVNIKDNEIYKGDIQFMFMLTDNEGAELSKDNSGYINIVDNDTVEKSLFQITNINQYVDMDKDSVKVTVTRVRGNDHIDTINIATEDDTARAGIDYIANKTQLVFIGGVSERTFEVKLNKNRKYGDSFYVVLDNAYNTVDKGTGKAKITFGKENENSVALFSADEVSNSDGSASIEYKTLDIKANVTSKNSSENRSVNFNESMVSKVVVYYNYNVGTKNCKKMDYGGSGKILVNGQEYYLNLRDSGSSGITATIQNGKLSSIGCSASTSGKNTNYKLNITGVSIFRGTGTININNRAFANNCYSPRVWAAVENTALFTKGSTTYVADKSENVDGITRYYNFKDPNNNYNNKNTLISKLIFAKNSENDSVSFVHDETLNLTDSFQNGWNSDSAYLYDVRIVKGNKVKSLGAVKNIVFNEDFFDTYGDYIDTSNPANPVVNIVPVYRPKVAYVYAHNVESDKGDFSGLNGSNNVFRVSMNDSVVLQGYGAGGYHNNGMAVSHNKPAGGDDELKIALDKKTTMTTDTNTGEPVIKSVDFDPINYGWIDSGTVTVNKDNIPDGYSYSEDSITSVMFPVASRYVDVVPTYGDTRLGFLLHPRYPQYKDNVAVFYTGDDGTVENSVDGKLYINNPVMGKKYVAQALMSTIKSGTIDYKDDSDKNNDDYENKEIKLLKEDGSVFESVMTDYTGVFNFKTLDTLDRYKTYNYSVSFELNGNKAVAPVTIKNNRLTKSTAFTIDKDGSITYEQKNIDYTNYMMRWTDGTYSNDTDGSRTVEQTNFAKKLGIDVDAVYYGSLFSYVFDKYYDSKVYYEIMAKDDSKYTNSGKFSGKIAYREKELFTNNVIVTPAKGALVTIDGNGVSTDENGYFEYAYEKGYHDLETYGMLISYGNMNYADIIRPLQEKEYQLDSEKVVSVSNGSITKNGKEIKYTDMGFDNSDCQMKITAEVQSNNQLVVPVKAVITAYTYSCTPIGTNEVTINNNSFSYEFNPGKYKAGDTAEEITLPQGTTFTIKVIDQNGAMYGEFKTGLSVNQAVDEIGLNASITPPFGNVDLLGNTSMNIDPSATTKGEDAPNNSYKLTDDEARRFTADTVLPYNFNIKSAPTVKAAATPGDNPNVNGFIGSDYVVFNLGFDFSGNPSDGRTPLTKDAPLREKLLDSFKNNNFKLAMDKFNMTKGKLQDEHGNYKNKSTAMSANFNFDVSLFLRMGWLRDKNGNMYFADAALTEYAGISGNFSFQVYYVIPFVVDAGCTLAFTGTQLWIAKPSKDSENTIKLGTINTGELLKKTDSLSGPGSYHYYNVGLSFSVELYGGIGIACMKVQIGGQAVFGYDYSSYFYEPDESEKVLGNKKIDETINTGYIDLTAKVRLKLLIFSTELNIAHKRWKWDDKNRSKAETDALSLFNGTMSLANSAEAFKPADSSFKLDDVSYLEDRKGWLGGQKSKLMRLADNNEKIGFDESTLIDKVYEDAEPKLINLDNGKYLLLYLDAINGSTDIGLHYSVFDGNNWSKPQLVCDDCITSHKPSVYDLGDSVAVAWANVSTTNDNAVAESLNSMNIKLAFFDKNSQVFSDCRDVTKETVNDTFSDNYPVISRGIRNGRDTLIIYYYKSAYNEENTVIGDMINPETFMVCRFFDLESNEFIDNYSDDEKNDIVSSSPSINIDNYEKQWYGQRFINLSPKVQVNEASVMNDDGTWKAQAKFAPATTSAYANIIDYCVEDYDNKTLIAYILDEDDNYQTTNDRQVYVQIYYYNEDRYSDAIKVTSTETECYCPTMLKLNNTLYLTWADEAGIECADLGNIIKNCIEEVNVDGITTEIINKQQDGYYQAPTLLIPNDEDSNIYDFVVQTDNKDVAYIGWVKSETVIKDGIDSESDEAMLNENRIAESAVYIARYTADNDRLSIPVKMTNENAANYSQIVFDVTDDNKVKAVATKSYSEIISQGIGENGEPAEYIGDSGKARSLVTMDFDVVKDINIIDSSLENVVYGDTPYANINIKNEGFVDAENLKLVISDNNDGKIIAKQEGINLRSGESYTASHTLKQITNLGDYDVNITLYNETGDILDEVYKDAEIASKVVIDITDETYLNRETLLLNFKAVNEGNYPSEKTDVNVYCREDKVIEKAAAVGELAPGESVNGSVIIELTPDMFVADESYADGYKETAEISLITKDSADSVIENREVTLDQITAFGNTSKLNSSYDNTVKVGVGQDIDLNISTDGDSSNLKFVAYSMDNSIVRAYDMGVITGIQKGSTQVTVYAIPYCDRIILSENGRYEAVDLESVPEKYMVKKTFNIEVVDDEQSTSEPTTETTTKARSSGGGVGVSKQNTTTTEVTTESITVSAEAITEVTTNAPADNVPFKDIKGKWYENAVSKLYNLGIAAGVSDTEFAPDTSIRRGDFIMLIMNMLGDKVNTDAEHNDFSDVAENSYYHDNIIKARNCGIACGFGDNSFKPDEFITREEMFSFTARALKLMNMLEDSNSELNFFDKSDISAYAVEDITKLYSMGIVNGFTDNTILPKANTTRAEAAQIVYNVIDIISAK